MSRFDPLTEAAVAAATEDGLTFGELSALLEEHGLSIDHVVYDPSRTFQNSFYADPDRGCYFPIFLQRGYMPALGEVLNLIQQGGGSQHLAEGTGRPTISWMSPSPC